MPSWRILDAAIATNLPVRRVGPEAAAERIIVSPFQPSGYRLDLSSSSTRMKISRRLEARSTVERSRFFAVAFPCEREDDVLLEVKARKGEFRKANHHCWALRIRDAAGVAFEKSKDDGEVGHPGRILLELLKKHDLEGAIIVSRVFGGVKLGVGGVSRAFRDVGEAALSGMA